MTTKVDGTNGVLQSYDYQVMTTGFSYTFAAGITNLIMNPAGTLATGTITMPASPADGMTITFSSTQLITALTVNGNSGQTVVGAPTTLTAGAVVVLVYRLSATTWITQVNTNSTATAAPATYIYTANTTWTKPATIKSVKVTVIGGGGGGGGAYKDSNPGNATAPGGGGGGGGFGWFPAPSIPGPVAVTIGAGGAGVGASRFTISGANPGGSSSFGSLITATGASGETGGTVTPSPTVIGARGFPAGSITGYSGGASWGNWGTGGTPVPSNPISNGTPATGFGSGGGGAASVTGPTVGGNGTAGFVIVEEFY